MLQNHHRGPDISCSDRGDTGCLNTLNSFTDICKLKTKMFKTFAVFLHELVNPVFWILRLYQVKPQAVITGFNHHVFLGTVMLVGAQGGCL